MGGKALGGERLTRIDAGLLFWRLIEDIREFVGKIQPAGSYRREKESLGDLDIVVVPTDTEKFDAWCIKMFGKQKNGKPQRSGLISGAQVEFYVATKENWGSQLQMWTGSAKHNVILRQRAKQMGYSLSQYGLRLIEGKNLIEFDTEERLYSALGMDFPQPKERE